MTVASLSPLLKQRFADNNGIPLASGTLSTFSAGTTTPIVTYVDSTGTTTNTNPIVLDARGEANVWTLPNVGYKYVLKDTLGNTIYTIDNVINSNLLTLFGGVDTGATNAYIVNFTASFQSLSNGIIVYFIPANTNTGPSTLNVNSLGVIPILNQDSTPLASGQIVAGQLAGVIYYNGNWLIISTLVPTHGNFTMTLVGGTTAPTATCFWSKSGNLVTLVLPTLSAVSNTNTFSFSGLPSALQPGTLGQGVPVAIALNNSAAASGVFAVVAPTNGSVVFGINGSVTGWTASGTKAIGLIAPPFTPSTITYTV